MVDINDVAHALNDIEALDKLIKDIKRRLGTTNDQVIISRKEWELLEKFL